MRSQPRRAPLKDVQIVFTVTGWKSKQVVAEKRFTVAALGFDKAVQEFDFDPVALADGVVIKAVVQADGKEERYEYYYAGDKAEHESRYNPFATKGQALPGAKGDAYFVKPPRKQKTFDKPDFAKVARPAADKYKCLVVFGLYTHILNLDDALAGWKGKNGAAPEFTWANCPPNAIETFPGSYDELFAYNAVVLSDVNFKAIGDIGFEMLCDYVAEGGSLLVVGRPVRAGQRGVRGHAVPGGAAGEAVGAVRPEMGGQGQVLGFGRGEGGRPAAGRRVVRAEAEGVLASLRDAEGGHAGGADGGGQAGADPGPLRQGQGGAADPEPDRQGSSRRDRLVELERLVPAGEERLHLAGRVRGDR